MKLTALATLSACLLLGGCSSPSPKQSNLHLQAPTADEINSVSPAMRKYTTRVMFDEVWNRPGLTTRDKSLVTLAAVISKGQAVEIPFHMRRALDNGVTPAEISEAIVHLGFYSGWANATLSAGIAHEIFAQRGIAQSDVPPADVELLPLDMEAEGARERRVQESFGEVAPGVVEYTRDVLFRDLWLRSGLAPRDRSLVTVVSLISNGQTAQVPTHLNRAMDNGLTSKEASEVLTQLAFYAGWPNVFSALPVVKKVLEERSN